MSDFGLKLDRKCPHCGEELMVLLKRDLSKPDKPFMSAVVHGLLESLALNIEWHPVTDRDVVHLPESNGIPW